MNPLSKTQQRTRQNLINALKTLYATKPLDKISIRDITNKAGYNRSTFYLYFTDIYNLAEAAEDDLIYQLSQEAQKLLKSEPVPTMESFMLGFAGDSAKYAHQIHVFSEAKSFQIKFEALIKPIFAKVSGINPDHDYFDYVLSFIFSTMLHNLNYWYTHQDDITLQQTIELSKQLIAPGIQLWHFPATA